MKFKFKSQFALAPNVDGDESGGVPPTVPSEGNEDLTGLKTALGKERQRANEADKNFKALQASFDGIDPTAAKQALDNYKKLTEQQEEWNQRETALKTSLTEESNRRVQTEAKKAQEWQSKHDGLLTRTLAQQAYEAAGGRGGGSDDGVTFFDSFYNNVAGSLKLNDKGQLEVVDGTGARIFSTKNTTEPMNAVEFFSSKAAHPVYSYSFAANSNSKGSGMTPGAGRTPANGMVRVIDRNDMSALAEPGVIEAIASGNGSIVLR